MEDYKKTGTFVLKESFATLLAVFVAALAFAIFICFYPGPGEIGFYFWILFLVPLLLAIGIGIKMLTLKPIMTIDKRGIKYYRSGIEIKWNHFQKATIAQMESGNDTDEYLIVYYYKPNHPHLLQIEMKMNSLHDQEASDILEAIQYFRHGR